MKKIVLITYALSILLLGNGGDYLKTETNHTVDQIAEDDLIPGNHSTTIG